MSPAYLALVVIVAGVLPAPPTTVIALALTACCILLALKPGASR